MSRPQKIHKPIKGAFNNILASIAAGTKTGKQPPNKPVNHQAKSQRSDTRKKPE